MLSVEQVKEFFESELSGIAFVDFIDTYWVYADSEVCFIEDGESYSFDTRGILKEVCGWAIFNGENGCGETITYFLKLSKQMTEEEFYEKHDQ